ncbi:MAG: DUF1820 family protein [Gammaproteobacteria bacterium]
MTRKRVYKVIFFNQGKIYEVFAKQVTQGGLFGFIEIEGLIFGERSGLLVDPAEDRLKTEFDGVKRTYVPLHAVVRIDEVEKEGTAKILQGDNITPFPLHIYSPGGDTGKP